MTDLLAKESMFGQDLNFDKNHNPAKKHIGFIILMAIFLAMVFARNILDIPIPVFILLAVSCVIAFLGDLNEIVALAASCIPLSTAFQYKYGLLFCILVILLKYHKKMTRPYFLLPVIAMAIWEMLHGFSYAFSIVEFLRQFTEILFCSVLLTLSMKIDGYKLIFRTFAISTIVCCTIILLNLLIENNFNFFAIFATGDYRLGVGDEEIVNFGVNFNSNRLGNICNMAIVGLLLLIRKKEQAVLDYVLIGILTVFGVMTLSRAFIICYALILVLFILSIRGVGKKIKTITISLLVLIVLFVIINVFAPYLIQNFIFRFQEEDISNGRNDLMVFYNSFLFSSPKHMFFGVGLQDIMLKLNSYNVTTVPHNAIQEILVVWGVLGLVLLVTYIFSIIRASGIEKYSLINFIPLIMLLIMVQSGQLIRSGPMLLMFVVTYVALSMDFNTTKDQNEDDKI